MPCRVHLSSDGRPRYSSEIAKRSRIASRNLASACKIRLQLLELRQSQRAGDISEPIVKPEQPHFVVPLSFSLTLPGIARNAVITKSPQRLCVVGAVGGDHAALSCRKVLHWMETEDRHMRNAANSAIPVFGAESIRSVFNHSHSIAVSKFQDRIQIGRMSRVIDPKYLSRPRRDCRRSLLRIQLQSIGADVGKNRSASLVQHSVCRDRKRHGSSDGFLAWLESRRKGGAMQRRRAGTETHGVLRSNPCGESFLELSDLGTRRKPIGAQYVHDGLNVIFSDRLPPIREQGLSNRRSPIDGEYFVVHGCHRHRIVLD